MRILLVMAPKFFNGTTKERVNCLLAISAWFCMGAYLSSVLTFYADAYFAADLSGQTPAIVGGLVAAVFAAAKMT